MASNQDIAATPHVQGVHALPGHVIISTRWLGTELAQNLQKLVSVQPEENLGVIDFHPSNTSAVIYLSEADILVDETYKRRIVKLRKLTTMRGLVMIERTLTTEPNFSVIQKFVVTTLGMSIIPITSPAEAAKILAKMAEVESSPSKNILSSKPSSPCNDASTLNMLCKIPKLGQVKARGLLSHFKTLESISTAEEEQMFETFLVLAGQDSSMDIDVLIDEITFDGQEPSEHSMQFTDSIQVLIPMTDHQTAINKFKYATSKFQSATSMFQSAFDIFQSTTIKFQSDTDKVKLAVGKLQPASSEYQATAKAYQSASRDYRLATYFYESATEEYESAINKYKLSYYDLLADCPFACLAK